MSNSTPPSSSSSSKKHHYRSIFISDVHLGSKACQADALLEFLKHNTSDNLFLVGDIIDGWRLKKKWYFPQSHANVVRKILSISKKGTSVYYVLGNHDEAARKFLTFDISIGNIKIINRHEYLALNGRRYLVIHGDMFDGFLLNPKNRWLMHLGDHAYNFLVWVNLHLNRVRHWMGMGYWSLSKFIKSRTKSAVSYINSFEDRVSDYCKKKSFDGIICGHIHVPEIKEINGVEYMNDGDWCETCSALVETLDGKFELVFPHSSNNNNDQEQRKNPSHAS